MGEEEEVVYLREGGVGREAEDTVMESRSILRTTAHQVRLLEEEKAALVVEKQNLMRASQELLGQDEDNQLPFDPDDPKVKELEEWECSVSRSVVVEESPRSRLTKLMKLKRRAPYHTGETIEEKTLLERRNYDDDDDDDDVSVDCINSWLLSIFVKVFD